MLHSAPELRVMSERVKVSLGRFIALADQHDSSWISDTGAPTYGPKVPRKLSPGFTLG